MSAEKESDFLKNEREERESRWFIVAMGCALLFVLSIVGKCTYESRIAEQTKKDFVKECFARGGDPIIHKQCPACDPNLTCNHVKRADVP